MESGEPRYANGESGDKSRAGALTEVIFKQTRGDHQSLAHLTTHLPGGTRPSGVLPELVLIQLGRAETIDRLAFLHEVQFIAGDEASVVRIPAEQHLFPFEAR